MISTGLARRTHVLLLTCIVGCATGQHRFLRVPAQDLGACTEQRNVRMLVRPTGSAACAVLLLYPNTSDNEAKQLRGTMLLRKDQRVVFEHSFDSANWGNADGWVKDGSHYHARIISGDTGVDACMESGKANAVELIVWFAEKPPIGSELAFYYLPWHWRLIP